MIEHLNDMLNDLKEEQDYLRNQTEITQSLLFEQQARMKVVMEEKDRLNRMILDELKRLSQKEKENYFQLSAPTEQYFRKSQSPQEQNKDIYERIVNIIKEKAGRNGLSVTALKKEVYETTDKRWNNFSTVIKTILTKYPEVSRVGRLLFYNGTKEIMEQKENPSSN